MLIISRILPKMARTLNAGKRFTRRGFTPVAFRLILLIGVGLLTISGCDDDGGSASPQPMGSFWRLGGNTYNRATSSQSKVPGTPDLWVIVTTTAGPATLGAFSGSAVSVKFYDFGEGTYAIVDEETFITQGSSGAYLTFDCSIGTAVTTGSSLYAPTTTSRQATVTKENDQFFVTIQSPVTLTKILDVNGGVSGAENTYDFIGNRIN